MIDEAAAIAEPSIRTDPPDVLEIARAMGRLENGRAAGIRNIPLEVIKAAGFQTGLRYLFRLFCNFEEITGIGERGSYYHCTKAGSPKMDCSNFKGITLLSAPERSSRTYYWTVSSLSSMRAAPGAKWIQSREIDGGPYPDPRHSAPNKKRILSTTLCGVR